MDFDPTFCYQGLPGYYLDAILKYICNMMNDWRILDTSPIAV